MVHLMAHHHLAARHDPSFPADLAQEEKHFHSGINNPGEILGLSGRLGISCEEIRGGLLEAIHERAGGSLCMFVDSGAFSEVEFHDDGPPTVDQEITHAEWIARLGIYAEIAESYRTRAFIVAPDMVGNQSVTLERQARYGHIVSTIAQQHRCQVIVPVQKGSRPMWEFFALELMTLRLGVDRGGEAIYPIAGIPMRNDATTLEELGEFARHMPRDARFHLLGLGPASDNFRAAIDTILEHCPDADITSDSGTLRRLVGRTNGRHYGPRTYTFAQDTARALGLERAELKRHACGTVSHEMHMQTLARAYAEGWQDPELDGQRPGWDLEFTTVPAKDRRS
jgi:hypothetical protein